eukprot:Sspe_Gene.89053::Locus_60918_Transcript_1_1_Confidence_1.000_Length_688::g.89053::m.89053/K11407/HDAC6; histone deacetylase 6
MSLKGAPRTGLVWDARTNLHRCPEDHVEAPLRTRFVVGQLQDTKLTQRCRRVPARPATDDELSRVHTAEHIKTVDATAKGKKLVESGQDEDMYSCLGTGQAARLAVGGLVDLCKEVVTGNLQNGFAAIRPPGHHCNSAAPSGFCVYSNVAVAVRAVQHELGVKRVMIFDWDVHHGNGTEWVFYDDPSVLVVSVHGHGVGRSHTMRP